MDNTYFTCRETPIALTTDIINQVKQSQTVDESYRLLAPAPGIPTVTVASDLSGCLLIGGSSTNSLSINGVNCTWLETRFLVPGSHKINDTDPVPDAELHVYFKNDQRATDLYCLVVPVKTGPGRGTAYFQSLGIVQRSYPTFTSLLPESPNFILYVGKDMRNRNRAATFCSTDQGRISYIVTLDYAYIEAPVLARLKTQAGAATRLPAIQVSDKKPLLSYIPSIKVVKTLAPAPQKSSYVETAQVKCRPLDRTRDISGNVIYVGGKERKGDTSLDKELERAADFSGGFEEPTATVEGSDIETILGIILGVIVGIVVCAFVVVFVFQKTETNYREVLKKLYPASAFERVANFAERVLKKPDLCAKAVADAVAKAQN